MKEDKELIKEIVARLKAKEDVAYREGAWERFKEMESSSPAFTMRRLRAIASVAAVLVSCLFAVYFMFKSQPNDAIDKALVSVVENNDAAESNTKENQPLISTEQETVVLADIKPSSTESLVAVSSNSAVLSELLGVELTLNPVMLQGIELPQMSKSTISTNTSLHAFTPESHSESTQSLLKNLVLANNNLSNAMISNSTADKSLSPKSFNYGNKFSLGLFVAPNSTVDNFKVGAGFTLAYNINNKISVRTGASYNNYEVGVLKDPLAPGSVEQVSAKVTDLNYDASNSASAQVLKLAIPNVSAVSGFVSSVEIPLEIKYNLNKSFYATAGVSYSTIINQERNAQYIENANVNTFNNGFPVNEKEASKSLKAVTKTVQSSENNVNTNGYNGFVNFSVGKKVNLNKKFGLSVEPFFKIPVGEFRRSDMNYTNGGVRIMTTF